MKSIDTRQHISGRLIAIKPDGRNARGRRVWLCRCDCGKTVRIEANLITAKRQKSCGCLHSDNLRKRNTKHGRYGTRLYGIWIGMRSRCKNKNTKDYKNYGERRILFCQEWDDFTAFRKWAILNGYAFHLTIERRNNNGNYEPSNCCWIPKSEQSKNRRERTLFPERNKYGKFISGHK